MKRTFVVLAAVCLSIVFIEAPSRDLYRYKDENGNWVYTDRQPPEDVATDTIQIDVGFDEPLVNVERRQRDDGIDLVVINTYHCPVEVGILISDAVNVSGVNADGVSAVVAAAGESVIARLQPADPGASWGFQYQAMVMLGDPKASHTPDQPYRVPFSVATSHNVTQAYPGGISHNDDSSRYAIDFAMPVGSAVFTARSGTVVDIATKFFQSGTSLERDGPRANIVRILHDDGTMAIYAHLNRSSIRVRPGDSVGTGEYIADSGNTGFSTGPHLHFDVQKNAGFRLISIPFEFLGQNGSVVYPAPGESVTAYQ